MRSISQFRNVRSSGFTLIELLVVLTMVILLTFVGLNSYSGFVIKQRDGERKLQLHRFAGLLERYRSEKGVYPCGSGNDNVCFLPGSKPVDELYEFSCSYSNSNYLIAGDGMNAHGNDAAEISKFLNGGSCCGNKHNPPTYSSYPDPTSTPYLDIPGIVECAADDGRTCDDSGWGLHRWGYPDMADVKDPLNVVMNGKQYAYCYAVTGAGRTEYALFVRMEKSDMNKSDEGGVLDNWYEIYSPGYHKDVDPNTATGWSPLLITVDQATWQ